MKCLSINTVEPTISRVHTHTRVTKRATWRTHLVDFVPVASAVLPEQSPSLRRLVSQYKKRRVLDSFSEMYGRKVWVVLSGRSIKHYQVEGAGRAHQLSWSCVVVHPCRLMEGSWSPPVEPILSAIKGEKKVDVWAPRYSLWPCVVSFVCVEIPSA